MNRKLTKAYFRWFIYANIVMIIGVTASFAYFFKDRLRLIPKYFESNTESPLSIKEELDDSFKAIAIEERAKEAYQFAKDNHFDLTHAILIDYSIHSGKDRFFVWNFPENKIEFQSLVAHGYGNQGFESTNQEIIFSNTTNSYATSLGKYKLGVRSYSQYGINIHYKMHGLEDTNSNAYQRYIVLHSYKSIPDKETFPNYLPLGYSQGCPVIDDDTMRKVDDLLKTKQKPVLLWSYYLE